MRRRGRIRALAGALLITIAVVVAGCGSDGDASATGRAEVVVSAATSLKSAFTTYGEQSGDREERFSFAGSDELAAQIRAGARPDVFASANTALPEALFEEGLVERPRVFATNRLVLAVPADGSDVASLDDLPGKGVSIVVGSASVPIGAYTRKVLSRLGAAARADILANVRSNEPDVGGITAKLTQGAADAGFLYATDVVAANGRLKAIELPAELQPDVAYAAAIVEGAEHREQAQAFVAGLLGGSAAGALTEAGFEPRGQ
ncbi:MAG: molybdate ABC transporter substrate-binding protein [Thermoleophilia bacterium]